MKLALKPENLAQLVFLIRGEKVMFDVDLARLYGVSTKALNQAFRRNKQRFPSDFAFQLSKEEFDHLRSQIVTTSPAMANLRSQIVTSSLHGGRAPRLSLRFDDQIEEQRHDNDRNRADHQQHIVTRSTLRWHQIILHDRFLDLLQVPEYVNKRNDYGDQRNGGNNANRQQLRCHSQNQVCRVALNDC